MEGQGLPAGAGAPAALRPALAEVLAVARAAAPFCCVRPTPLSGAVIVASTLCGELQDRWSAAAGGCEDQPRRQLTDGLTVKSKMQS